MPALGPAILPFCFLYAAMMSRYRAVAKRRGAYAAMPRLGMPPFSVFSVFSVRNFFCFYKNLATLKFGVPRRSQKGQRQDRLKFGALAAPRRRSQGVSLCPLCVLRVLCAKLLLFLQKPCHAKVRRSQAFPERPKTRQTKVRRSRGTSKAFSGRFSVSSLCTPCSLCETSFVFTKTLPR